MLKAGARNEAASGRAMSLMALAGKLQSNARQDSSWCFFFLPVYPDS